MTEEQEIRVGQIWRSRKSGLEVTVLETHENFVGIDRGGRKTFPWEKSFRAGYEFVSEVAR